MNLPLLTLALSSEADLVLVRQRTRTIAELLGFDVHDQTRLATAVSEIARNAVQYGGGGKVRFNVEGRTPPQILTIVIADRGPGIAHLDEILGGRYKSPTGMGMGIVGARRLVDKLAIEAVPGGGGTRVTLTKLLPRGAPMIRAADLPRLAETAVLRVPETPLEGLRRQNQELLQTLATLRERQDELVRLNSELEDTNRGVVALFAELDEKADHLRRADEMKTRFLSNMSHEFRTPLNAIRGLSNLLLERLDGDLTAEQDRQVQLISRAAHDLTELVDDLLDLAKVEAGKVDVRPVEFDVRNLLAALRGMLRPMWLNSSVALVFEEPNDVPPLYTDEGKVSQILRNLLSNALKFTERGEVRVTTVANPAGDRVVLSVVDTGIGIAPEDQDRIFLEFTQLEHPLQKRAKGTGLGLPLSRKLAEMLGGTLGVTSVVGQGSRFTLDIPVRYEAPADVPLPPGPAEASTLLPVLAIEDSPETVLLYEKYLQGSPFQIVSAATLARARQVLARRPISAIILDIVLRSEDTWSFLVELKSSPSTQSIPVIVATFLDDSRKAFALNADAFVQKPPSRRWLLDALQRLTIGSRKALIVDDDETARYLLGRVLGEMGWTAVEARDGSGGIEMAGAEQPDAILLDLDLPDRGGEEVLAALAGQAATRDIPVVLVSSREPATADGKPPHGAAAVLSKSLPPAEMRARLSQVLQPLPRHTASGAAVAASHGEKRREQ